MQSKIWAITAYIFITLMTLITLFPFVYMAFVSFMTYEELISLKLIPSGFDLSNYKEVLGQASFVRYFLNTVYTATLSTLATLCTTILATFAFVKLNFPGKKILLMILVCLLMVPYEVLVFCNYLTIAQWGLMNTYTGLILPSTASVFYIFYLNSFLKMMSVTYYERARVVGASDLEFIVKILIPLSKPGICTVALLSFIDGWNSFLWPMLITNDSNMRLLSDGLSAFSMQTDRDFPLQMTATTITTIPIVIFYFIFRNQIISSVVNTGIKN
ncbi:MAG: sugar ABC transporter permease [Epulopiscium sp. Nele67-Bin002]|nr:MAG: sugar ABC transporter permease [Epulopiscium sp. Nuni2H_MBin001]OON91982.1 MAG: sugar ABC transporter permease [Epulopiscium sp. Nele67-Bin002]OON92595.1 MAG: sugar ABC transporter permease [Epulopiscium sp. Nele67-Bin001]